MISRLASFAFVVCAIHASVSLAAARAIPTPLPDHPGNIFLGGKDVTVNVPAKWMGQWKLVDFDGKQISTGEAKDGHAKFGKLSVGYYELKPADGPPKLLALQGVREGMFVCTHRTADRLPGDKAAGHAQH